MPASTMALSLSRPPSMAMCLAFSLFLCFLLLIRSGDPSKLLSPSYSQRQRSHLHPLSNRSVVGKVTMLYGDNAIYEKALKGHERQNELHGYDMTVLREQLLDGFWSKPAFILSRLLQELAKPEADRLEWIVWFDVDILIMNYKIPLEIFLPPPGSYPSINCLVTDDHRGLNNGVFFLRVNNWSVWLMTAVLGYQKVGCRPPGKLRTQDQGALENIIREPQFRSYTIHVPQRWFNAFAGFRDETLMRTTKYKANSVREGDLLVHFAGHKPTREATMEKWMAYQDEHYKEWELDLDKTNYLVEINKFWTEEAPKEIPAQVRFFPGGTGMVD